MAWVTCGLWGGGILGVLYIRMIDMDRYKIYDGWMDGLVRFLLLSSFIAKGIGGWHFLLFYSLVTSLSPPSHSLFTCKSTANFRYS